MTCILTPATLQYLTCCIPQKKRRLGSKVQLEEWKKTAPITRLGSNSNDADERGAPTEVDYGKALLSID